MITANDNLVRRWKDAATLCLGVWLALSPTVLDYIAQDTPDLNVTVVGIVIAVAAAAALVDFRRWHEWLITALGGWLLVSPYLLGYAQRAIVARNQMVVGLLVGGLALWSALAKL